MDIIKRMEPAWLALVVVGALNWLLVGLFEWNLVTEIFDDADRHRCDLRHRRPGRRDDAPAAVRGLSASGRPDARDRHVAAPARRTGGAHPVRNASAATPSAPPSPLRAPR